MDAEQLREQIRESYQSLRIGLTFQEALGNFKHRRR